MDNTEQTETGGRRVFKGKQTSHYGQKEEFGRGSVRWAGKGGHQGTKSNPTEWGGLRGAAKGAESKPPTETEIEMAQETSPSAWRLWTAEFRKGYGEKLSPDDRKSIKYQAYRKLEELGLLD
jgi:hypothetical protein